jgi:hypothetical protein
VRLFAALVPALLIVAGFVVYCLADMVRHPAVRHLPRWAWALLSLVSMPLGAIAYLLFGRSEQR